MSRDLSDDAWKDPGGPEPDDEAWLTPASGWSWDTDALMLGEYVGYPLYLRLRDRLQSLRLPPETHNQVITELIDMHDAGMLDYGVACSSLVVRVNPLGDSYLFHQVEMFDAKELAPLSGDTWSDQGPFEK